MFRSSLPCAFLLLMALLAAAAPAQAVVDIDAVTLEVTIARSSLVSDQITAELRVTGTDLNNGTITVPILGAPPIPLQKDGPDLFLDDSFRNLAELDAVLPNGTYVLHVNNGTVVANLLYSRAAVPNPAISQPDAGQTLPPGPVELLFMNCAVCSLAGDSVEAVLEDDMAVVLDADTLTSADTDWTPDDDMGSDLQLPELSAFVARVTHTDLQQANVVPSSGPDDLFVFNFPFVQSDEIDFETGFHTPAGHFCLAANYPAPPPGCKILADPLLQVLDMSGMFSTQLTGLDVDYTVVVESSGALTGSATADLDDIGSQETVTPEIKGKLSGKSGELKSKLSFALENPGLLAKVKLSLGDVLSILGNTISTTQKNSGSIGATKIKEEILSNGALPFTPLGWLLEFDVDAGTEVANALLTLEGGRNFSLSGTNKFKFASGESSLKLQSVDKGIRIGLKKLVLDDTTDPVGVTGGEVSPRILGQSGKATIP